jgi:predicted anti-sigma-YlaC factor YlaD
MVCWLFRLMISHSADNNNRPSGIIREHISHCANCRDFYNTCQALGESLTREALISNTRTPRRLKEHILNAVPSQRAKTHKVPMKLWIAAVAACAALIIVTGASLIIMNRDGRKDVQHNPQQMTIAIQGLRSVYTQVGRDLPATWPRVFEKPLENEFKSLTNDTQSAVRFLVACVDVDIAYAKGRPLN